MNNPTLWHTVQTWLEHEIISVGTFTLNTYQIVTALFILLMATVVSNISVRALRRVARLRNDIAESQIYTITRLLSYSIYVLAGFLALSVVGVTFDKIAIVAGALSVGIGFGLQNIVNNFISGIIILFEKSLRVGDFVELESGVLGEVREIRIRSTLIRTLGNEDILVPNSLFINSQVTNWTLGDDFKLVAIEFAVAFGSDPRLVMERVAAAACHHPHAVKDDDKLPGVLFAGFGDSSLNFKLMVWIRGELVKRPGFVKSAFLLMIHDVLKENGIAVPFPQRDLHIRSGLEPWLPTAVSPVADAEPAAGPTAGPAHATPDH